MKFQLLIKTKILTNEEVYCFKSLRCCIFHANVGILTFMSRINFMLSFVVEHGKSFITFQNLVQIVLIQILQSAP